MNTPTEQKRGRGRPKKEHPQKIYLETIRKLKIKIESLNDAFTETTRENAKLDKKLDEVLDENEQVITKLKKAEKALEQSIDSMNMFEAEVDKQDAVIKLLSEALFLTIGGKK